MVNAVTQHSLQQLALLTAEILFKENASIEHHFHQCFCSGYRWIEVVDKHLDGQRRTKQDCSFFFFLLNSLQTDLRFWSSASKCAASSSNSFTGHFSWIKYHKTVKLLPWFLSIIPPSWYLSSFNLPFSFYLEAVIPIVVHHARLC